MNRSGAAVGAFARYYKLDPGEILVAHDEVDLPPGVVRLKLGGGTAGHNGLADIVAALGSPDFVRLRIGVGRPGTSREVVRYVLARPPAAEQVAIDAAIARALACLPEIVRGEYQRAMNALHTAS
jgi:PTH1 family peptidyl-tRNA hydrolase